MMAVPSLTTGLRLRIFWSVLVGACLAAVVAIALLGHVPDAVEAPLVTPSPEWTFHALPLFESAGSQSVYVLQLRDDDPIALLASAELRLLFATYEGRLQLTSATLAALGTPCTYETRPGADFAAKTELSFFRGYGCHVLHTVPTGDFQLTVHLARRARIALWTYQPPSAPTAPLSLRGLRLPGPGLSQPFVDGKSVSPLPDSHTRRIDLLNYVWQLSSTSHWIWIGVVVAVALFVLGGMVLSLPIPSGPSSTLRLAGRAGIGAACLAAGLTLCYVILVPPFQAPDEPDHLLAFANVTGQRDLSRAAERWAQLMHFQRIRFHPTERFRVGDIAKPFPVPWDRDVFAEDVAARSVTTFRLWTTLGRVMTHGSVQQTLFGLRLVNAMIFAVAIGLACGSVVWCTTASGSQLAWFTFLFVPALPFFAMHVSEFAVLTSIYVLVATAGLILFLGGPRSHYAGLTLGVTGALLMTSGRSAAPLGPVLVAALIGRAIVGQSGSMTRAAYTRCAAIFWAGLPVGALVFAGWSTAGYRQQLATQAQHVVPRLGSWLDSRGQVLSVAVAVGVGGLACEMLFAWLRARITGRWLAGATRVVARAAALLLIATMIWTIGPWLPQAASASSSSWDYVADVLRTVAMGFRLHDPDTLLASSFWVGFGWLETFPPEPLVVALTTMTGFAFAALLWRLAREGDARRVALGMIHAAGWCASLVVYAVSVHSLSDYSLPRVLSGRYLIGLYLSGLVIAWSGLLLAPSAGVQAHGHQARRFVAPLPVVLLTLCGVVHAYCLSFILRRYF